MVNVNSDDIAEKRLQEFAPVEASKRLKLCEVQEGGLGLGQDPATSPAQPLNLSHLSPGLDKEAATSSSASDGSKPNYTYTDLITLALRDKTALTVSGIYQWITDNYPYYKAEDDRWKNSVRHNLSMNPNFRKGGRAKQGTGHVWVLADQTDLNRQVSQQTGRLLSDFTVQRIHINLMVCCVFQFYAL